MPKYEAGQVLAYNNHILRVLNIAHNSGYFCETIQKGFFIKMAIWYKFADIDNFAKPLSEKDWLKAAKYLSLLNGAINAYNEAIKDIINQ